MEQKAQREQVAAAEAYEDLFVPALMQQWAGRVVEAAAIRPGDRVLDVACGTGVLAREAAMYAAPGGVVAGVDPAGGMLEVAGRLSPGIEWRQAAAESLPYADGSFDAVISQFGLMFFTDRIQALREMRRVLREGGRVAVAVWASLGSTPGYAAEVELVERMAGEAAADPLRAPFALGDVDQLEELAASAGLASTRVASHPGVARFPSVRAMVEADLHGWLPLMGVNLPDDLIEAILKEAENALRDFVEADGSAVFDLPAHIITGTRG